MMTVEVCYKTQQHSLPLVAVKGDGPSLLGRDWLGKLRLDWSELHQIQSTAPGPLKELLDRHSEVFKDELGIIQGTTAKIQVDPTVQPRFCKARSVPYALRAKVDAELERLDREGIIEKVTYAKWAAPIVPVVKQDGTIIHLWRLQIDGQQSSQDGLLLPPTCGRPVCLIVHWLAGRPSASSTFPMPTYNCSWMTTLSPCSPSTPARVSSNTSVFHLAWPLHRPFFSGQSRAS